MGPGRWVPQFLMKMALEVSKTRHFFRCAGYRGGLRPESATLTTTIIHAQSGAPVDAPGLEILSNRKLKVPATLSF